MDATVFSLVLVLLVQSGFTDEVVIVGNDGRLVDADSSSESALTSVQREVREGDILIVCYNRTGRLEEEVGLELIGLRTSEVDADFENIPDKIESGQDCTSIETVSDKTFERTKVFTVTLDSHSTISYNVSLRDNDGPDIECSDNFVLTQNLTEILQQQGSCFSTADVPECPDDDKSDVFKDCTRWTADSAMSVKNFSDPSVLFPNLLSRCAAQVRDLLVATFNTSHVPIDQDIYLKSCHTNCLATLVYDNREEELYNVSVFLLENVNARSVFNLTSRSFQLPQDCGVYNVTCCEQSFLEECFRERSGLRPTAPPVGETGDQLAPIVGGVVGSVVGLSCLIVAAVTICVLACVAQKKKKQKQWKRNPSTLVQSIVYKPKRMESACPSSVSQDSTAASCAPLTQNGGGRVGYFSSVSQPNYEEVTYTESYSEWKTKFGKVIIDVNDLQYGDVIGEGEFSTVYHATYTKTDTEVAVKTLKGATEHEEVEKFIKESAIMLDFDHRNILHLVGVCFNTEDNLPAIVLPYMANGDLRSFLRTKREEIAITKSTRQRYPEKKQKYPEGLSEAILIGMCMDVAQGMHYLSKCKFVHRDLAARNCMVDENLVVKVADFGLSRDIHVSDYYRLKHRQRMPVKWMAPESLFTKIYTEKTDVWSFGIVCWEIFKLGKKPYAGIDNPDLPSYISHGFRPKKPSRAPDELFQLMQQTWMEDPQERPDFRAIVLHLARLMKYEGDIESDLKMETKNCSQVHEGNQSASRTEPQSPQQNGHVYSVLEPVYSNCSQEESSDSLEAEQYEVPVLSCPDSGPGVLGAEDLVSTIPMEYEIPQSTPERKRKNPTTSATAPTRSKPEVPARKSPAHTSKPRPTAPVCIPGRVEQDDEIHYEVPATLNEEDTTYWHLSYPAVEKAVSVPPPDLELGSPPPSSEAPYSKLERNRDYYNSLPSKFTHVYHTLEPHDL